MSVYSKRTNCLLTYLHVLRILQVDDSKQMVSYKLSMEVSCHNVYTLTKYYQLYNQVIKSTKVV